LGVALLKYLALTPPRYVMHWCWSLWQQCVGCANSRQRCRCRRRAGATPTYQSSAHHRNPTWRIRWKLSNDNLGTRASSSAGLCGV